MKRSTLAVLVAGQLTVAAQPVFAAELAEHRTQEMGAFAGLRLRLPLDGNAQQRQLRAGLTVAPTMLSRTIRGESRTQIGEGLELGVGGREPVRLLIAGQDVRRLGAAQQNGDEQDDDEGRGPSTLGWVAIGVGAVAVTAAGLWALCFSGTICNLDDD